MITVSSCGVKLQEVFSGLEEKAKTLDMHMHFCGFSQHRSFIHYFIFFLSTWGVICLFFFVSFTFCQQTPLNLKWTLEWLNRRKDVKGIVISICTPFARHSYYYHCFTSSQSGSEADQSWTRGLCKFILVVQTKKVEHFTNCLGIYLDVTMHPKILGTSWMSHKGGSNKS